MRLPFWVPAAWMGLMLACHPRATLPALLGYHALCLVGAWPWRRRAAWGRFPAKAWVACGALLFLALGAYGLPRIPAFPADHVRELAVRWPGGIPGHLAYVLLFNVPAEEGFWRLAQVQQHPTWGPARHGLAFGLHHALGVGLVLGWAWAPLALLATAAAGALWTRLVRRQGGIGLPLVLHALADTALLALAAGQIR